MIVCMCAVVVLLGCIGIMLKMICDALDEIADTLDKAREDTKE